MLWILARLREIRVRAFDQRILIAVPELLFQSEVSIVTMLLVVDCAFSGVGIVG